MVEAALQWSAVLLKRTKARIKPLFELNRTAAGVASSNNGMPAEFWRAKKITCKRILKEKNFIVNQGVEKKIHD